MAKWHEIIRKNKSHILIFLLIFVIGIFLRVYRFNDFLIFGFDQARDATLVKNIIENHQSLPLLGPHAMGTRFKVGPIYYYFQYLSAVLTGDEPQNLAYPDLIFSILTIPLLFIFLKKYFDKKVSLALMGLWSVSFFAIKFSRFAWNPNALPFFTLLLLYALLEITNKENKKKILWLVVAGIALGIGIQLHTLSLLIVPIVTAIFLWLKLDVKKDKFKVISIIFAVALSLNTPQIISEIQTGGGNTKAFVRGVEDKLKVHTELTTDFFTDIACHVQANSMIISSFGNTANCSFGNLSGNKSGIVSISIVWMRIIFAFIFSILGYAALYYFWKKETNNSKRNFLQLISLFVVVSFLVFFLLADEATDRYYLIFAFVPIIILGLMYDYLRKKNPHAPIIGILVLALLIVQNGITLKKYFTPFQRVGLMEDSLLSENKDLADFILSNMQGQKTAYLDQKQGDWRTINYFLTDKITLVHITKSITSLDNAMPYFLITDTAHAKTGGQVNEYLAGYKHMKQASFGVFVVTVFSK